MALTLKKRVNTEQEGPKPATEKLVKVANGKFGKKTFLSGTRFVLFIGDEGGILLYLKQNTVVSRQFVPDASEQNLEELRGIMQVDDNAPLSIVLDVMDQTYSQQTLPPVSSMSVKKLIDRRLKRDFAPQDIKGAIQLGREKTGRQDWNFLMVSIERTKQIALWLDFVLLLPNHFQGIYLASVETEIVVKNLEQSMGIPKEGTGAKWKIVVSHNKVGGFRQVVLRDGRIIFTRLSQPIGDATPEIIAGNIEQEMQSTIEYVKRLTFNPQAGLDIYIIVSNTIQPLIDKSKFAANTFHTMTPFEVAGYLGIEGATQPTDQFGDVILAASIAASPKHVLRLTTPEAKKYDMLYYLFHLQRIMAAVAIFGLLVYACGIARGIYLQYSQSEDLEVTKRAHQKNFDDLHQEIKKSSLDVDDTGDLMDDYQHLINVSVLPFGFINKVREIIKPPIIIKHMSWSVDDKTAEGNALLPPKISAVIILQFTNVTDAKTFKVASAKLIDDLKPALKGFTIAFGALPAKYTEVESMNVNLDATDAAVKNNTEAPDVPLTFKEQ